MKLSKVLKKDIIKHLGITPDKRRKDFKQFIAENGGYNNAIETLKSRLNEPDKIWNTKFSYVLHNHLSSSKLTFDGLELKDLIDVFQYYKIPKYLIEKLKELGKGYKVNIGFDITLLKSEEEGDISLVSYFN